MTDKKLIGVLGVAFRAERFISAWCRQLRISDSRFELFPLAVCGEKGWHSDWKQDDTPRIASEEGVHVLEGNWETDSQQRNAGLEYLRDLGCEWALVIDTDEFYTRVGISALVHSLSGPYDVLRAPMMDVYWKSPHFKIKPAQHDNPIVAIKTDREFSFSRLSQSLGQESHARLHHMSYVRTDREMLAKIQSFEHHFEILPEWYENVWNAWELGNVNLHPVVPTQFFQAVLEPAPDEILELLA